MKAKEAFIIDLVGKNATNLFLFKKSPNGQFH